MCGVCVLCVSVLMYEVYVQYVWVNHIFVCVCVCVCLCGCVHACESESVCVCGVCECVNV